MKYLLAFVQFWYDFIVGDDWSVAAGVVLALIAVLLITRAGVSAWWIMPLAVALLLGNSLRRASRGPR